MKTNPSIHGGKVTEVTTNRRQFLTNGLRHLMAATLLGSLLLSGASAKAGAPMKHMAFYNLTATPSTVKNGNSMIFRGQLFYRSEKGDMRYLDKPSVPVTLWVGNRPVATGYTDKSGQVTFPHRYSHPFPLGNRGSVVSWHLHFGGIHYLRSARSQTNYFTVVK